MTTVHPIGTEFEYTYAPSLECTVWEYTTYRYRVTGHEQAGGRLRERVEPIAGPDTYPATLVIHADGHLTWEPKVDRFIVRYRA